MINKANFSEIGKKDMEIDWFAQYLESKYNNTPDYYVDGVLYCGKCNSPKAVKLHIKDKYRIARCRCNCTIRGRR